MVADVILDDFLEIFREPVATHGAGFGHGLRKFYRHLVEQDFHGIGSQKPVRMFLQLFRQTKCRNNAGIGD
jgi:hypothetical protein